jgi:hypothetical protein
MGPGAEPRSPIQRRSAIAMGIETNDVVNVGPFSRAARVLDFHRDKVLLKACDKPRQMLMRSWTAQWPAGRSAPALRRISERIRQHTPPYDLVP